MNKQSSIYLDQFAVDKLLSEKLSQVSHIPGPPVKAFRLEDLDKRSFSPAAAGFETTAGSITFNSPLQGEYSGNNRCLVNIYPAAEEKGCLIFVHGLYEENRDIYKYLFMLLNKRGYTVYLYILPYHYERKPAASLFSGEYFWSARFDRSLGAFRQAVEELYLLHRYLREDCRKDVSFCGFSMGAAILFNLAAGTTLPTRFFLASPITDLARQLWISRLWQTIRRDYEKWQIPAGMIEQIYSPISPESWSAIKTDQQNIMCVCGEYDQLIDCRATLEFFSRFPGVSRKVFKCGHLNMLRIPRLAEDIDLFLGNPESLQRDQV